LCQSGLEKIQALIGKQETLKTLKFSCFSMKAFVRSGHGDELVSIFIINTCISNNIHVRKLCRVSIAAFPAEIICIFNKVNELRWSQR